MRHHLPLYISLTVATVLVNTALAETYSLATPPLLSQIEQKRQYGPLADYLSAVTGEDIQHLTAVNYISYWERMRKGSYYDLVLDGAHLVDFRIKQLKHVPIAKVTNVLSYSFVTAPNTQVFDTSELIGKPVAGLPAPSLGAVQLLNIFPNPVRQPLLIQVDDISQVIERLKNGSVVGAFIPTPMAAIYPELNVVQTTAQMPHIAMTASPRVPEAAVLKIRAALLDAGKTEAGRKMLQSINVEGFEPTEAATYGGFSRLLDGVWGYQTE